MNKASTTTKVALPSRKEKKSSGTHHGDENKTSCSHKQVFFVNEDMLPARNKSTYLRQ